MSNLKKDVKTLFCLVGASGSGKTTIAQYMKKMGMVELVSHTTRAPREKDGEIHGVHYYFVTDEEFDKIDKIEESAYIGEYRYGISVNEVNSKFEISSKLFTIVDLYGANHIKAKCVELNVDVKVIYVQSDLEIMEERMINRGDSLESVNKRLAFAKSSKELENDKYADYIIDNRGSLEDSIKQLKEIIQSEKSYEMDICSFNN